LAPTVSVPAELSRSSASEFSSSWRRFSKRRANSSTVRPASVSTRSLAERSISFSPNSVSRRCKRQRDGGLRAQQPVRGARKALLGGYRQEDLERVQFHANSSITKYYTDR
jgi:hypothetical protein